MNHHGSKATVVGEGLLTESGEVATRRSRTRFRQQRRRRRSASRGWGPSAPDASSRRPTAGRSPPRWPAAAEARRRSRPATRTSASSSTTTSRSTRPRSCSGGRLARAAAAGARRASTSIRSARGRPTRRRRSSTRPTAPLQARQDVRDRGHPAQQGLTCPRRRPDGGGEAQGDHPRPAQRREPRGRADAPRLHALPQPRPRHPALVGAAGAALRPRARDRHEALPVDAPHRLPAADLRAGIVNNVFERPEGVRGRRRADGRADDADRVLRGRLPAGALDDPGDLQLEPRLRRRLRRPLPPVRVLGRSGSLGGSRSRATGSPTSAGSTTSRRRGGTTSRCPSASSTVPCASTRPSRPRSVRSGFDFSEANLAFRNLTRAKMVRLATGQQMATFMKNKGVNLKLTNAQIRDGRNGAGLERLTGLSARHSSRTPRSGSTSCARPSSTRAS